MDAVEEYANSTKEKEVSSYERKKEDTIVKTMKNQFFVLITMRQANGLASSVA